MTTPKRDLRSSGSLWLANPAKGPKSRRRPSASKYDVAIIGAGVSGALAAAALVGLGKSVVILDRRGAGEGSTAASTAMIQWEIDSSLTQLSEKVGGRLASRAYQSSIEGVLALRRTILSLGIDCDWTDRTALTITGDAMGQRALADELKARRKLGLPSYWMEGNDLKATYGIDRTAALVNGMNGELHPLKLTQALLARAIADGMELVSPVDVTEINAAPGFVSLSLDGGKTLEVGQLIVCAGYEALPQIPKHLYKLISTWAIATKPLPPHMLPAARPLAWEQSDPYLYFRTSADNRMIAGGEDEDFNSPAKRDALIPKKSAVILKKLKALMPGFGGEIAHAWAGTFADSPTGLPAIGPVPGMPRVFATLGAGGNGITFSAIAAGIAKEWVQGRRHKDLSLYRFT
jgi:glycine/D-amino acid oxidase-like deaminating enzyme